MPKIIGKSVCVVNHEGLTIDELCGNVATKNDKISIAHVKVSEPCSEPWLTLHYDEWICCLRGKIELHYGQSNVLTVHAGETVFVEKGERFRPVFPEGDTEYIPVCLPAFRPDRCIREEENSKVSKKLQELHNTQNLKQDFSSVEKLYHMCQNSLWHEAMIKQEAYYPPTFEKDGMFTHATAVPQRLIETANHFYTDVEGEWICLELSRNALYRIGIDTVFEEAKPVGETNVSNTWEYWVCPHIYGGLPTTIKGIVTNIFPMKRDSDGTFLSIEGLTDF